MTMNGWDKTRIEKELLLTVELLMKRRTALANLTYKRTRKEVRRTWLDIRLAQLEAPIIKEVCEAVNENGKPMFPNESLRKAEIETRLAKDPEIGPLTRKAGLYQKLSISDLRYDEAIISLEVKHYEAIERILFHALEKE
ncbi:unnamed protein product [marine sediment metagenome]|uniref:Uncharacterized protein n=1 Tax=marine sediment metagenome TaxID=412755 RepID=X1QAA6_9ZZZZ